MQRELDRFFGPQAASSPASGAARAQGQDSLAALRRQIAELRQRLAHYQAPSPPTSLEGWFDLKHSRQPELTLKEIATRSGYSYGYVRRRHTQYQAQRSHK